ncbi:MAG: 3-hydroxybutyryl-CoA dehydrogenase [Geminicoccaceae bacterium]|nr:3-hydroxybutyryl-CoA dehydrogenase [Geminicoccaceae bacterium]
MAGASASEIRTIGVVGAGQMGPGIAQVCAVAGYDVRLQDINATALEKAVAGIAARLDRQVAKGEMAAGARQETLARIRTGTALESLEDSDLVIESAVEKEAIKREIFERLCPIVGKNTIFCTNTSSISVTMLAAHTDRPERFMGMHFMNPVPVMKLVELIRAISTDDATCLTVEAVVDRLGKSPVMSADYPAFIVNRVLLPMINEAIYALHEGVGDVAGIDKALRLGAAHPMGPLQLADFIGLDTCLAIMRVLYEGTSDSKYRPCPLLVKYVEAGWLGRESQRGFYDYRVEPPAPNFRGLRPV